MSDPLTPPPRRPAPDHLRAGIARTLRQAPSRRLRSRTVVIPLAAASVLAASALGISMLTGQQAVRPADPATGYPATASPTATASADRSASPDGSKSSIRPSTAPPSSLVVRAMTRSEIAADTKSCRKAQAEDNLPRSGPPKARYAMVERTGGTTGPTEKEQRILLTEDAVGLWVCENGSNTSWSRGGLTYQKPTAKVPAVEVDSFGDFRAGCGEQWNVRADELFAVGDAVRAGRARIVNGDTRGPWQTSEPVGGLVHFLLGLEGAEAQSLSIYAEYQFLDDAGTIVTIQPYGERGTPVATTVRERISTCADSETMRHHPTAVKRPKSDAAGIKTCLAMVKESAGNSGVPYSKRWASRLVVSNGLEWGAVLSDGQRRVGCSLFPTKEISPFAADTTLVNAASFSFALNPIAVIGGESLWAAGRLPADVTKLSYRLPGKRDVAATIGPDGYWMMKFHQDGSSLDSAEDVRDWDPVVVTVSRPSGDQRFTLKFSEKTMCHQVSHGC